MRSRLAALLGAVLLMGLCVAAAFAAAPPGKVTIEADGCAFTIHIDLNHAYDLIGWKVKEYDAANWNEGLTLFKGSGPTDGNGDLVVGPFSAPEGHYTVAVDDEYPPDGSSIVIDFWLSCPASSSDTGGSEAPIDNSAAPASTQPSAPPAASELPAASAAPSGEVKGITGTPPPGDLTPPPTDTAAPNAPTDGPGWPVTLVVILALSLVAVALLAGPIAAVVRATVSRRHR